MPCLVVPSANPTPFLAEKVITDIQTKIATDCALWLDVVYPVAFVGEELFNIEVKGNLNPTRLRKYPRIYINDGDTDYIDATANDNLKGYCFFEIRDEYDFDRTENEADITVSIIFWANLRKIDDRGYDYKTELISDAIKCVHTSPYANDISTIRVQENFEDVFDRYEFQGTSNRSRNEQTELQQFMYPYTAFKLTFSLRTNLDPSCLPSFTIQSSPSDC